MVELFPLWARKRPAANPGGSDAKRNPGPCSGKRPRPRQVQGSTALLPATRGPWARAAPTRAASARAAVPWRRGRPWTLGACAGPAPAAARDGGSREAPRGPAPPRPHGSGAAMAPTGAAPTCMGGIPSAISARSAGSWWQTSSGGRAWAQLQLPLSSPRPWMPSC